MRFQVGRRPDATESPVATMEDCHGRIRDLTAVAVRLGGPVAADPDEVAEAATRVSRYFSESLPLHEADEEESMRPRLVGVSPTVDAALADMTAQHGELHGHVDELVEITSAIAADPARRDGLSARLGVVTATLEGLWAVHLGLEESVLFPAVAALDAESRSEFRAEMRARRA